MVDIQHKDITGADAAHPPFYASESDPTTTLGAYRGWIKPSTGEVKIRNATNDDWIAISGTGGGAVSSVFGRTGDILPVAEDYNALQVAYGGFPELDAENVWEALDELAIEKVDETRTISTTAPLTGGGDLSANRTLAISAASETAQGAIELATQTETDTGTDDTRAITPLKAATRFLAKAGGTLTGFLTLHADPTSALHAVTKQYADGLVVGGSSPADETTAGIAEIATQTEVNTGTDDARIVSPLKAATRYLAKAGGTLTGFLTLHADPSSAMHAVTKQYADGLVSGGASPADETTAGIAEIATQTETNTGTDDARIVTPLKLASRTSTDTRAGVVELATDAETQTGTDTARAITPANLSARSATESRSGVLEIATQTETDAGTNDTNAVTPLKLANYSGLGGGGSSYRTLVTLGSDVANTTTAFADVTGLSFAVSSGTVYRFEVLLVYDAAATTTGSKWAINGPASPTLLGYQVWWTLNATGVNIQYNNTYDTGNTGTQSAYTSGNSVWIRGLIKPSTSGTVVVRFASEVAASAITAKAGSTLEWW